MALDEDAIDLEAATEALRLAVDGLRKVRQAWARGAPRDVAQAKRQLEEAQARVLDARRRLEAALARYRLEEK